MESPAPKNKKALLIGIDYIDVSGISLKGCINDIINMRNMLIDAYGYSPDNVTMLRDDDPEKYTCPTHDNIYDSIVGLVIESGNLEEIWLHYSGHGSRIHIQNSESSGDILIPVDYSSAGCISDTDLYDIVRRIKCRAFLTFDCCHSGTVCDLPWQLEYRQDIMLATQVNAYKINNPHIFMFSGCKDDQTRADTTNLLDQRMGAFTNAFTECLRKSNHNTDILSLHKDICIGLLNSGYSQTPILSCTVETPQHTFKRPMTVQALNPPSMLFQRRTLMHKYVKPMVPVKTDKIEENLLRGLLPIISSGDSVSSGGSSSHSSLHRYLFS